MPRTRWAGGALLAGLLGCLACAGESRAGDHGYVWGVPGETEALGTLYGPWSYDHGYPPAPGTPYHQVFYLTPPEVTAQSVQARLAALGVPPVPPPTVFLKPPPVLPPQLIPPPPKAPEPEKNDDKKGKKLPDDDE
jgi:hypothetical protein